MSNVDVPLDLDNEACCDIIALHIKDNFSSASFEVFTNLVGHNMFDLEAITVAAGKAVLNEAIIEVLKAGVTADEAE